MTKLSGWLRYGLMAAQIWRRVYENLTRVDWKEKNKIKKLPAFLRGPAAKVISTRYLQTTERRIKMQSKCLLMPCSYNPTRSKNTTTGL